MTQTDSRARLLVGALLLVVGASLLFVNYRALATFLLDVVVQTISPAPSPPLEPYDFSWGTMHWGRTPAEFSMLCAGLLLIAVGQALVLPLAIRRIRCSSPEARRAFPKLMIVGAVVLTLIAAGGFLLIPLTTKSAFGYIAVSGGVDPVGLAEELPVRSSQVFMISLVGAQLMLMLAAFTVPKFGSVNSISDGKVPSIAACACFFLFALLMAFARLGPVRVFTDVGSGKSPADPAALAGQIGLALNLMLVATPLLAVSAILTGVAVIMSAKSGA